MPSRSHDGFTNEKRTPAVGSSSRSWPMRLEARAPQSWVPWRGSRGGQDQRRRCPRSGSRVVRRVDKRWATSDSRLPAVSDHWFAPPLIPIPLGAYNGRTHSEGETTEHVSTDQLFEVRQALVVGLWPTRESSLGRCPQSQAVQLRRVRSRLEVQEVIDTGMARPSAGRLTAMRSRGDRIVLGGQVVMVVAQQGDGGG